MKKNTLILIFLILFISISVHSQTLNTYMVPMRDNIKLATDVYLPSDFTGTLPALLVRTPYNKNDLKDIGNYLTQTYSMAVVIQDARGRYASEGEFCFFRCDGAGELQDGIDTVNWIRSQSWSNKMVATYGASALGITQYMLASTGIDLSAMIVEVATPDLYGGIAFQNGCFRKADVEGWLKGINEEWVLNEIKANTLYNSYWDVVDVTDNFDKVKVPTIHRGGWFDMFLQGTIDAYVGYQHSGGEGARGKQKLIIGPRVHGVVPGESTKVGYLLFAQDAKDIPQEWLTVVLIWLMHYLNVDPNPEYINSLPNVIYYTMGDVNDSTAGGNEWRTADDWPIPAANMRMYLHPEKRLSFDCPVSTDAFSQYRYDPSDPTPTIGGNNLAIENGPRDQSPIEGRKDVLVFSTDILSSPMEITGRVKAHIFTSIDAIDTDIMIRITDVYPDGKSILIMDGAQRLAALKGRDKLEFVNKNEIVEAVIDLWSTSIIINKGHRLRVIISSSNYPRFEKNLNDGTSYGQNGVATPVNVKIYHNKNYMSYIELPDPTKKESDVHYCNTVVDAGYDITPSDISDTTVVDIKTDEGLTDEGLVDISFSDSLSGDTNLPEDTVLMDTLPFDTIDKDVQIELDGGQSTTSTGSSGCSCNLLGF